MKEAVMQFLNKEIELGHLPGAVIQIGYRGQIVLHEATGYRSVYPEKSSMKLDTIFDLASLTKVVATLPVILKLVDDGALRLDDTVAYFIPEFATKGKKDITIRQLLTHSSGLPGHRSFFKENFSTDAIIQKICEEELDYIPNQSVVYSDLGFILLYRIVEIITARPFKDVVHQFILEPLEMTATTFQPTYPDERYAVTEYSERSGKYKSGIVHDDNTEAMGGISGHAGLFSTMEDMHRFAMMIENGGVYKGKRIVSSAVLKLANINYTSFANESRGLGWMKKNPVSPSCGDLFSDESFGHTGFTGTSIWFDPKVDLHVILLTNRVHYGREMNEIIRLRPRLQNLIYAHI